MANSNSRERVDSVTRRLHGTSSAPSGCKGCAWWCVLAGLTLSALVASQWPGAHLPRDPQALRRSVSGGSCGGRTRHPRLHECSAQDHRGYAQLTAAGLINSVVHTVQPRRDPACVGKSWALSWSDLLLWYGRPRAPCGVAPALPARASRGVEQVLQASPLLPLPHQGLPRRLHLQRVHGHAGTTLTPPYHTPHRVGGRRTCNMDAM